MAELNDAIPESLAAAVTIMSAPRLLYPALSAGYLARRVSEVVELRRRWLGESSPDR
jgi:hypothetical protein